MTGVGYKTPPVEHQFKTGHSGNPNGRPRGRKNKPKKERPHPLDEMTEIKVRGKTSTVPAFQAILRIAEDYCIMNPDENVVTRFLLNMSETMRVARAKLAKKPGKPIVSFKTEKKSFGINQVECLEDALDLLDGAQILNLYSPNAKMVLKPWLVDEALKRLGDRQLTRLEQKKVYEQTRMPNRVEWPDWWDADLRGKRHRSETERAGGS